MKTRNLIILPFVAVILVSLNTWRECVRFADIFYFSPLDLSLRLNESINNDSGITLVIIRLFHNKVIGSIIDILTNLLLFISPVFLSHLLSVAGFCGLVLGVWYLWNRKNKRLSIIVTGLLILFPLIEIIIKPSLPFYLRLFIIALPLIGLSLYGLGTFCSFKTTSKKRVLLLLLLLILSVWWVYVLGHESAKFCIISQ